MKNKILPTVLALGLLLLPGLSGAQNAEATGYGITTANTDFTYPVNDLLVYPNPTADITHIVLPVSSTGVVSVYVIDMNGNIVRTVQYPLGIYRLDVDMSSLPMGVYSVHVSGNGVGSHILMIAKG